MKILIIQTAFIGDVVLSSPLIESLKASYPSSEIHFLVKKGNEALLQDHPHLARVHVLDKKKKISSIVHLIRAFRNERFDFIINTHRFLSSGLITIFSKGQNTVGFDKNPLSVFYSIRIPHVISEQGEQHEVDRNSKLIESLVTHQVRRPRLYPREIDYEKVPDYSYICIAPCSIWFTKQWPLEKWVDLVNGMPSSIVIHLIGGPADVSTCEEIKSKVENTDQVIISAGKGHILTSVALIEKAKMTFTNDSAPMHFASAVNAPVSAIYCSTVPSFGFGPLSDQHFVFETDKDLDCRPCGLHGKKQCPEGHFNCSEIDFKKILSSLTNQE